MRWLTGAGLLELEATDTPAGPLPPPLPPPGSRVGVASTLAPFTFPTGGLTKAQILAVPTLQRAHDVIVALVQGLPLIPYRRTWDAVALEVVETPVEPLPWHERPDPGKNRAEFLGALASDLWTFGRAYCRVTSRYQSPGTYPASFAWMPFERVTITYPTSSPPEYGLVPGCRVTFAGAAVNYADVVEFKTPTTGVAEVAWQTIYTALELGAAAARFAGAKTAAGWLQVLPGGDPQGPKQLQEMATGFEASRVTNTIAALNEFVEYHESQADPSRLQLVEARQFQALELARVGNVPAYLVGAPSATGMTYQNAQQAKSESVDFGAAPIIVTINQTLSGPRISPAAHGVRLDVEAWLANPFAFDPNSPATPSPGAYQPAGGA